VQSHYAYVLEIPGQPSAVFTWPNVIKKYIRDVYSNSEGSLVLPPPGRLVLKRYKVNPKAGQTIVIDHIGDIEHFVTH
jgi:hypothetical protein